MSTPTATTSREPTLSRRAIELAARQLSLLHASLAALQDAAIRYDGEILEERAEALQSLLDDAEDALTGIQDALDAALA